MRKVAHTRNMEGNPIPAGLPASPEAAKPLCKHNCKSCRTQKKILKEQKKQTGILLKILEKQPKAEASNKIVATTQAELEDLIDRTEACRLLDCGLTKFYELRGELTIHKFGGKPFYYKHEVLQLKLRIRKPK